MLMLLAFGCSLAPAAASAELADTATLTSGDPNRPADLYFVQNGMIGPIGFATIEASSRPDGTQPAGSWMVHLGGGNGPTWQGDVTCLSVAGNRAVLGVEGTLFDIRGTPFPFVGFIGLLDGGPPAPVPGFSFPWPYPGVFNPPDHFELRELPAGPAPRRLPCPGGPAAGLRARGPARQRCHGRRRALQGGVQARRLAGARVREPGPVRRRRDPRAEALSAPLSGARSAGAR